MLNLYHCMVRFMKPEDDYFASVNMYVVASNWNDILTQVTRGMPVGQEFTITNCELLAMSTPDKDEEYSKLVL